MLLADEIELIVMRCVGVAMTGYLVLFLELGQYKINDVEGLRVVLTSDALAIRLALAAQL